MNKTWMALGLALATMASSGAVQADTRVFFSMGAPMVAAPAYAAPQTNRVWQEGHWVQQGYQQIWVPGHWVSMRSVPSPYYAHPTASRGWGRHHHHHEWHRGW